MNIKFRLNRNIDVAALAAKSKKATHKAKTTLVSQVKNDSDRFVPYLDGDLREQVDEHFDEAQLHYTMEYAKPQYYGCPNKTTPGTTMQWFEHAKAQHKIQWCKLFEAAYWSNYG